MNIRRFLKDAALVAVFTLPTWRFGVEVSDPVTRFVLLGAILFITFGVMYARVIDDWRVALGLAIFPVVAGYAAIWATWSGGAFALAYAVVGAGGFLYGSYLVGWVRQKELVRAEGH